eukprot:gene29061-36128_t
MTTPSPTPIPPAPSGSQPVVPSAPPPVSRRIRLDTIFTLDPGAHYAKTPATPGLAITAAARKSIRLLRKEGFENTVAKNMLSSVLGAKDARFTAGEKHADLIWLHLVEAIEKHFVNEFDTFVDLFRLTDPTVECSEDANDLLYATLEHLIKP